MVLRSFLSAALGVATWVTFIGLTSQATAGVVTLEWNPNSEDDLAGYRVYYGTQSRQYSVTLDVGPVTEVEIPRLTGGQTYYFAVTAYDQSGNESDYSQEVNATVASDPEPPPIEPDDPGDPEVPQVPLQIPVLYQNYPNPFSAGGGGPLSASGAQSFAASQALQTLIHFELPEAGHATVKIFDALGRELMTLLDSDVNSGIHSVYWDGRDAQGWMVPSGTYFYQLVAGGIVQTKRMSFAR